MMRIGGCRSLLCGPGLACISVGAFALAGGIGAGYWRSVCIEAGAGVALFQGFRFFMLHRPRAVWLGAVAIAGVLAVAAAGWATAG